MLQLVAKIKIFFLSIFCFFLYVKFTLLKLYVYQIWLYFPAEIFYNHDPNTCNIILVILHAKTFYKFYNIKTLYWYFDGKSSSNQLRVSYDLPYSKLCPFYNLFRSVFFFFFSQIFCSTWGGG